MRHANLLLFCVCIATLSACVKAGKEVAEELGIIPSGCGADGARVQATVDGASFCADGQIVAVSDGTSANVSGIGLLGNTLTMQLDTLAPGTYAISEAENAILYLATGTPYVSMGDSAGALTIIAHDETAHTLKASFEATLRNEMSGAAKPVYASVEVTYTVAD